MQIWVDADACPVVIKDILYRAAMRTHIQLILVANQPLRVPASQYISTMRVRSGFDEADNTITRHLAAGDLIITADIPLAAEAMALGAYALNPRGEMYTTDSIRERLVMRDFMDTLRASGINTGGPATLGQTERKAFANSLDRFLRIHADGPDRQA